jgi:multidrug resistance efflux pump
MKTFYRVRAALQDAGPLISLVATLGAASWLYVGIGGQRGRVTGFAQAIPETVAPVELARVLAVNVSVGDEVAAGQVIATLDTSVLDAEIRVAEAQQTRLEADLRAEMATLEQRLDVDLETLQRQLALQREQQLQVNAEAKALDGEMSRVKQLVENRQAVLGDLTKLDLQQATVTALAIEKPRTVGLLATHIKAAEQRRQEMKGQTSATAAKLDAEARLARQSTELLEQRRSGYVLRATHAGRVASIDKQPGEVTAAGEPVVHLVSARERVVACVPERAALGLREGDTAHLWIHGHSGESLPGKAVALGPLVAELPARCWATPKLPMWGREVTLTLDHPVAVIPGQAFDITFDPSSVGAPPPAAAALGAPPATSAAASGGPVFMTVPPALSQRSRFEPSGLLTRAGESRYLVVSDDTGRDGDEGTPWLFAMSAAGVVEPEPVPVSGVAELNDIEGITAGDAGEIYLLSSQSYSKKGKRKASRTALLRLRPEGRGFRVDGEVHLAEMLDAAPARAASLGLTDGTRALDIEGLAFRQGALYLGLKAPLDPQGNAMIWRVGAPASLFSADKASPRRLDDASFALWGRARVDVDVAGQTTPGGISDLLFLADGSLALTSTPSTADGAAGALWRVDRPEGGALSPRLLQRFPGLKPEGIAPSLSPGKLMVVFDTGSAAPLFQELPWGL